MGEVIRVVRSGRFVGFYLRFYENGRRRQIASKQPTLAEARKMLLHIEARIARGEAGMPEARPHLSLSELIERFLGEYTRPRIKNASAYRARIRAVLRHVQPIASASADALRAPDITRLRDRLLQRLQAGTVRNVLASLSVVFAWALRQRWVQHNPVKGVEKPSAPPSLEFWTQAEVRSLLDAAKAQAAGSLDAQLQYLRVLFTLHTGVRKGELLGLRWCDLDLSSKRLTIARSYRTLPKSGKPRFLRLPDAIISALQAWEPICPKTDEGLVFPVKRQRGWGMAGDTHSLLRLPALLRTAGVRVLPHPWHALRHTFASHYVMSGGNLLALQKILGHSDVKTTLIYAHLAPDFLGDEMNRIRY